MDAEAIDFRYAPGWAHRLWLLAAPGSPHKTLVGPWGELRYAPPGRRQYDGDRGWWYQVAWAPQGESEPAPVQRVEDGAALHTAFAGRGDGTQAAVALQVWDSAGHGWDVVRLRGRGAGPSLTVRFNPNLRRLRKVLGPERLQLGSGVLTPLLLWDPTLGGPERADPDEDTLRLSWSAWPASGEAWVLLPLGWAEGGWESAPVWPAAPQALWEERVHAARALQARCASPFAAGTEARAFWDAAATGLLQLREQRLRYWYPQPGASHYRGYWVLDGAFIDEALTVAGHAEAARADLELLLAQQTSAGAFLSTVMPFALGHWKETGVGLWALARHLELTADRAWGARVMPAMASAVGWIGHLHAAGAREDPGAAPGAGLTPPGFGDGGLGWGLDYTNAFWLVGGLQAAAGAAAQLGHGARGDWAEQAAAARRRLAAAMARDFVPGQQGQPGYLPSSLGPQERSSATSGDARLQGQWGLMHALHPLEVVDPGDPVVAETLATVAAAERQGICAGIGWLAEGIWTYAAGFWGLALLKAGHYGHARRVLRAYMQHASPTRCWREEQSLRGVTPEQVLGDMPHGWAWAMYILLVRGLLVLESGGALRLLAGADRDLLGPGIAWSGQATRYGRLDLQLQPTAHGRWQLQARLQPPALAHAAWVAVHAPDGLRFRDGTQGSTADGRTLRLDPAALAAGLQAELEPEAGASGSPSGPRG